MTVPNVMPLESYTLIHDLDENRALLRLEGIVILPVGSEIELDAPKNARVERVRVLAPGGPLRAKRVVCLDVRVIK